MLAALFVLEVRKQFVVCRNIGMFLGHSSAYNETSRLGCGLHGDALS